MKDWNQYIQDCFETDLWGFVCLDYYNRLDAASRPSPSQFIDGILNSLGDRGVDAVAFHNVLLSVCVQLLGSDFDATMEKSLHFMTQRWATLRDEDLQGIINHYSVYGQSNVVTAKCRNLGRRDWTAIDQALISKNNMNIKTIGGIPSSGRQLLLFYCYSHKDEKLRDKLEEHLASLNREGIIDEWHDRKIGAGNEWAREIDQNLAKSHMILLLISSSFIKSEYCYAVEMKYALEQQAKGKAVVIPVILRACDWKNLAFAHLQVLPCDGVPVTDGSWENQDKAFLDVVTGIRRAVEHIKGSWSAV